MCYYVFVSKEGTMSRRSSGLRSLRSRNQDGRFRAKRSDTHVGTVEGTYGRDYGGRSDKHLGTLLRQRAARTLSRLLRRS